MRKINFLVRKAENRGDHGFWLGTAHESIMGDAGFRFALKTITNLTVHCGLRVNNSGGKRLEGIKIEEKIRVSSSL